MKRLTSYFSLVLISFIAFCPFALADEIYVTSSGVGINASMPDSNFEVDGNQLISGTLTVGDPSGTNLIVSDDRIDFTRDAMVYIANYGDDIQAGIRFQVNKNGAGQANILTINNSGESSFSDQLTVYGLLKTIGRLRVTNYSGSSTNHMCIDSSSEIVLCGASDLRVKKNIVPLNDALNKILTLQGVSFEYKDGLGDKEIGVIAQDVEKVFPELVTEQGDDKIKSVKYEQLVAPLIEAVKAQQIQISKLREQVQNLETRLNLDN